MFCDEKRTAREGRRKNLRVRVTDKNKVRGEFREKGRRG